MSSIGLLTYHSAYNFGSVLQAYATQQAILRLGCQTEIMNYRMAEQKRFYNNLLRTKYGIRTWIKDCSMFPIRGKRMLRAEKFEKFFRDFLILTSEVAEPEEVCAEWKDYETIVSGSDQIWNKHSCELAHNDWRYMDPYLLRGFSGRKVSYASSVGSMTNEELQKIFPALQQFDALSFRESVSAEKISAFLHRHVETVLDPTFLLTKDEWISQMNLHEQRDEKYIIAYFLGLKRFICTLPALSKFARRYDCPVRIVTPFVYLPYPDRHFKYDPDYGPVEFLNALYNAEAVVTDSYHGTILAVNFGKEFYSICSSGGAEYRKTDILGRLGLQDRIIHDVTELSELDLPPIDYAAVYGKLDTLRQHSLNYLKTTLRG